MSATETPITTLFPASKNPADLQGKAVQLVASNGDAMLFDASLLSTPAKDLSMYSVEGQSLGARSTANMYVVRTAGTYKFPLVYGNAIEGGVKNEAAYTRQGSTYTADFVNHLGVQITDPYIEKNANCQAYSAGLLWQTGQSLITSVQLVEGGDCKYVQFSTGAIPATNGLAVLFVKDSQGRIMWSWTIWLTSDELGPDDYTNHSPADYKLMSENIGTIWNDARTRCVNPHYQWGRKDAFVPPSAYNSGSQMTVYDISNNVITAGSTLGSSVIGVYGTDADGDASKTVANAIQNPGIFFTRYDSSSNTWCNLAWHNNFWNAAITASGDLGDNQASAIKTIYDPSPVGYMLPAGRAFTGFTTTGDNTSDSSQFNVVGSWANGWNMKKKSTDTVGNYYPASGYRAYDSGGLTGVGSDGGYWSFAPGSQALARYLSFDSGYVGPLDYYYRSGGFSVRPSREIL